MLDPLAYDFMLAVYHCPTRRIGYGRAHMMRLAVLVGVVVFSACNCQPRVVDQGGLELEPRSLDFGAVRSGTSARRIVTARNTARRSVHVTASLAQESRPGAFVVVTPEFDLEAGASSELVIEYRAAMAVTADVGVLSAREDGATEDVQVTLAAVTSMSTEDAGVVDAGVTDAGVVDAGVVDAGVIDAGVIEFPVFDGGGPCGLTNVLDVVLQPSAPAFNLQRTEPGVALVGGDFAFVWTESLPDAGEALFFARVAPSGRALIGPREVQPTGGSSTGSARLAWNGTEYAVARERVAVDGGSLLSARFSRLDATGALIPSSEVVLGEWARSWPVQQVLWNEAAHEWAMTWNTTDATHSVYVQRLDPTGQLIGTQRRLMGADFAYGAVPMVTHDGGYLLATSGQGPSPVALRRLDATLVEQASVNLGGTIIGPIDLTVADGPASTAVVHRNYDGTRNVGHLTLVDAQGNVRSPAPISLAAGASSVAYLDVVWNGASYTTVVTRFEPDGGVRLEEARYSETGQLLGTPRLLNCGSTQVFQARLAWNSGVHLLVYDVSNGARRMLIFP